VSAVLPLSQAAADRAPVPPAAPLQPPLLRAEALAAQLQARPELAALGESLRRLSDEQAALMAGSGLHRMLLPHECGGDECSVLEMFSALECVAKVDSAVAWCSMIGATSGVLAAYLPRLAAQDLFSQTPGLLLAGVHAPRGKAVRQRRIDAGVQAEGWHISGRWAWGSGTHHAQHVVVGCLAAADTDAHAAASASAAMAGTASSSAAPPAPQAPQALCAVVPRHALRPLGNWNSLGLKGSGSGEFEIDGVWVPAQHVAKLSSDPPLAATQGWSQQGPTGSSARPLFRFPIFGLLSVGIAAISAGLARQALEHFVALASSKQPQGSRRTLAERAVVQDALARCEAQTRAARAGLVEAIGGAWAAASGGDSQRQLALQDRISVRLACTHMAHTAAAVAERLYSLAGGDVVFDNSALQRAWRDAHVATQHLMVAEPTWELAGRHCLGQPVDEKMI
jgi:indole-3-acetate monooxygenase